MNYKYLFQVILALLPAAVATAEVSYEFVIDLSGSMNRYQRGASLKSHALEALKATLPIDRPYALRVFGHRVGLEDRERGCADSELVLQLGMHSSDEVQKKIGLLRAKGYTPLASSLSAVEQDLRASKGKRVVVILSDGIDSCDGDPIATVERLQAHGLDVIVNPVGIGLDRNAGALLAEIAQLTGGVFFNVSDPAQLTGALQKALTHTEGKPRKRPLPGDIGGSLDAGNTAESALEIRKDESQPGSIGARRGALHDDVDFFVLPVAAGEKFILQLESPDAKNITATVEDANRNELARVAVGQRESEIFSPPPNSERIWINISQSSEGIETKYKLKVLPLVEIN